METLSLTTARLETTSSLWIGRDLVSRCGELLNIKRFSTISLIADSGVRPIVEEAKTALGLTNDHVLYIQGGESSKTITELTRLWEFFVSQRLDRQSLVVAVGGGATTDVVGFSASTFMRGVSVVNIPTTLLAQVDASIGGKTGINFGETKNLLGTVHQPVGVIIDIDCLTTLPQRERRSGFAEIVKHGLICDPHYFSTVTSQPCISWTPDELATIVRRSCEIKQAVVESDPLEKGPRKKLNFGHTIGHAIESITLKTESPLTHGEAIAIGLAGEALLSHLTDRISTSTFEDVCNGITRTGLPLHLPFSLPYAALHEVMQRDKKNSNGKVKWTLLQNIGEAVIDIEVPEQLLEKALAFIQPREGTCTR